MDLSDRLVDLAVTVDLEARRHLKILLSAAVAEFMPGGAMPEDPTSLSALNVAVRAIANMQPHRDKVPPNAIVYRGRPDWMTNSLLCELQMESIALRSSAVRFHDHYVVSGAVCAERIASATALEEMVRHYVGRVSSTGKANYLYYDEEGLGIEPHLDTEDFSLNVVLMLEHVKPKQQPSALVLYPSDMPMERIYLEPGELIVFFADSVIHARERVKCREAIRIAAFGFSPEINAHGN